MNKLFAAVLVGIMCLSLCACGSGGDGKAETSAPETSGDMPLETLPESNESADYSLPESVTESESVTTEPVSEEEPTVTTTSASEATASVTNSATSDTSKGPAVTEPATKTEAPATTVTTTAPASTAAPAKTDAAPESSLDEEYEVEELETEFIENLDEWLASMGIDTGIIASGN